MIYTTTVILTRQNTNTKWTDISVTPDTYIQEKSTVTSLNGLTCTIIFESNSIPELPPTNWFELHQKTYRQQNGISRNVTVTDDAGNIVRTYQE